MQLFSWLDGRATIQKIITLDELLECDLFDNTEEWLSRAETQGLG